MRMSQDGRKRRRSGEHRGRGDCWPTSCTTMARSAPRAGSRAPSSPRARSRPIVTHAAAGRDRGALPAAPEAGAKPPRHPQLPGDPHRGERRIQRTGRGADGGRTRAETRRQAGRRDLPFAGGPDREALLPACGRAARPMPTAMPPRPRPTRRALRLLTQARHRPRRRRNWRENPRARSAKLRVARAHLCPRRPGRPGRARACRTFQRKGRR